MNRNMIQRMSSVAGFAGTMVAVAAAQPNLVVRIDSQVQANHSEVAFGQVPVGEARQIVVVLRNQSSEDLLFTENPPAILSTGFPGTFSVIQPALEVGNKLSPNGSTALAIRFEPTITTNIVMGAHLYLWTNASAAPFHLVINGQAAGPQTQVTLEGVAVPHLAAVAFPDTDAGAAREMVLTVTNQGSGPLTFGQPAAALETQDAGVMQLTQAPVGPLAPGASTELRVAFTPAAAGEYEASLVILVNERSSNLPAGEYQINLAGRALAAVDGDSQQDQPDVNEDVDDSDDSGDFDDSSDFGDPNDFADEFGDPNDFADPNSFGDDFGRETDDEDLEGSSIDDLAPFGPAPCGLGVGFFGMVSMLSLGGGRRMIARR